MERYRLRASLGALRDAQGWVADRGIAAGMADSSLFRLELACEEVLANVISYAYPEREGEIEMETRVEGGALAIVVSDRGVPFNPLEAPAPDIHQEIAQRRPGGLGIHLARVMSDEMEYRREGERNVLTLRWKLPGGKGEDGEVED